MGELVNVVVLQTRALELVHSTAGYYSLALYHIVLIHINETTIKDPLCIVTGHLHPTQLCACNYIGVAASALLHACKLKHVYW